MLTRAQLIPRSRRAPVPNRKGTGVPQAKPLTSWQAFGQSYPNRDEWLKRLEEIIALFEDAEALGRDIARPRPSDQG